MACTRGHIYCKECVYADLLQQKKDIKRHQAKIELMAKEEEEEKERAREAARERVIKDFERNQIGLAAKRENLKSSERQVDPKAGTEGESLRILALPEGSI